MEETMTSLHKSVTDKFCFEASYLYTLVASFNSYEFCSSYMPWRDFCTAVLWLISPYNVCWRRLQPVRCWTRCQVPWRRLLSSSSASQRNTSKVQTVDWVSANQQIGKHTATAFNFSQIINIPDAWISLVKTRELLYYWFVLQNASTPVTDVSQ